MKQSFLIAATVVALLVGQAHAIEKLRLSIVGSDVVLAWPSRTGETYIVQFRASFATNCPWETLTNTLPATGGTNWTAFVHASVFQCASGGAAAMAGGGGLIAAETAAQLTPEKRVARRAAAAEIRRARIAALKAEIWARKKRPPFPWEIGERPPLPWEAHLVDGSPAERDGQAGALMEGTSTPCIGFYRVVRNGIFFFGVTNGAVLSGRVTLPVEVGLTTGQTLDSLYANTGNNPAESVGVQGLEFAGLEDELPYAVWDTTQVPNGVHQINLGAVVGEVIDVPGSTLSLVVSNQIWFPDPYNWAGYFIEVQAQSVHASGTYHVEVFDDTDFKIIELDGPTDAQGYVTYQGGRGFRVQNYDPQTFEQYPSKFYRVVVATSPAGGGGFGPAAANGATSTNFVWVERAWPATTFQNLYTQFAIGYQPIYGNPTLGGGSAVTLQAMVQAVYTAAEGRAGGLGAVRGDSQNPFELWTQLDFTRLVRDLRFDEVRNLFYFGHGNPKFIGQKSPGRYLELTDFYLALNNKGDPLNPSALTNAHPFRFVFLDGCNTADGDLCKAFGIPKIKNMPAAQFFNKGLRYRAFLGWNGKQTIGWAGAINTQHTEFVGNFFGNWGLPDNSGNPRNVRQAIQAAGATWSQIQYLIVYGYEGLLWNDTLP